MDFFQETNISIISKEFVFLLDKGSSPINLKSSHYYDRMYPSKDVASSIGNYAGFSDFYVGKAKKVCDNNLTHDI